jgi:hypothetical protein
MGTASSQVGDDKSANKDNKTDNTTAGPPSLQTITTTNALVAPPSVTPEADQLKHVPQLPEQAAPAAQVATQLRPLDPDLLKAVVGKQSDLGKQGDADRKPTPESRPTPVSPAMELSTTPTSSPR